MCLSACNHKHKCSPKYQIDFDQIRSEIEIKVRPELDPCP